MLFKYLNPISWPSVQWSLRYFSFVTGNAITSIPATYSNGLWATGHPDLVARTRVSMVEAWTSTKDGVMGSCDQQTRPLITLLHSLNTFSSQIIQSWCCFAILLGVSGHIDEVLWSLVCLGSSKDRWRLVSHSWLKVLNMIHHSTPTSRPLEELLLSILCQLKLLPESTWNTTAAWQPRTGRRS